MTVNDERPPDIGVSDISARRDRLQRGIRRYFSAKCDEVTAP